MYCGISKLLNNIFIESKISRLLETDDDVTDRLKNCLEELCLSRPPSFFFSTEAFKGAPAKKLLLTVRVLVNYDFVTKWFFGTNFYSDTSPECCKSDTNAVVSLIETVYTNAKIPQISEEESAKEFIYVGPSECAELGLEIFLMLVKFVKTEKDTINAKQTYSVIIFSLLLCFEHLQKHQWTSENSLNLSQKLFEQLLDSLSLKELLMKPSLWNSDSFCLTDMLTLILPRLTSSNWKQNKASTFVMTKLLENLTYQVSCDLTLPPPLLFMDDFEDENVIMGLEGLNYILMNASKFELKQFGRVDVIFESLMRLLYTKNELILKNVLTNVLLLLQVTQSKTQDVGKEDKCEEVLGTILKQMQIENQVILRRIYCHHLQQFIELTGLASLKYIKTILRVIFSYLERYDGEQEVCRLKVLNVLQKLMEVTWPRIHLRATDVAKSLVRLLHELSGSSYDGDASVRRTMKSSIGDCLRTLNQLAPELQISLDSVLKSKLSDEFNSNLKEIFVKYT